MAVLGRESSGGRWARESDHRVFFPQKRLSYHDGTAPPAQEPLALAKAGSKRLVGGADAGGAVGVLGATNSGGLP